MRTVWPVKGVAVLDRGVVCSVVTRSHLAQARVLQGSLRATNPGLDFVLLVLDLDEDPVALSGRGVRVVDLGFLGDFELLQRMERIYDVIEFATAVKPFLLNRLLGEGYPVAIYLDADILVCGDLSGLISNISQSGILLTPHSLEPYPRDGLSPSELDIMRAGIFNLGFIGVDSSARAFLDWWSERLKTQSMVALDKGLFTDQRWIDWVPALFPVQVERAPGANVAYWNLHERELRVTGPLPEQAGGDVESVARQLGKSVSVNGQRLLFFHFSGYSPARPTDISHHFFGNQRVLLSDRSELAAIFQLYGDLLVAKGYDHESTKSPRSPWEVDGRDYGPEVRRFLREDYQLGFEDEIPLPDPSEHKDEFLAMLSSSRLVRRQLPFVGGGVVARIARLVRIIQRDGLRHTTKRVILMLRGWLWPTVRKIQQAAAKAALISTGPDISANLTLVRYANSEFSIGQAGARVEEILEQCGIQRQALSLTRQGRLTKRAVAIGGNIVERKTVLSVVNADETPRTIAQLGFWARRGKKVIGYWFWETSQVPVGVFGKAQESVDEVWVSTSFVAAALQPVLEKPVRLAPLPLFQPKRHGTGRAEPFQKGKSDFTVLAMADLSSVPARKNLKGAVAAYLEAFPSPGATTRLVLKMGSSARNPRAVSEEENLRSMVADRTDIEIITQTLSQNELDGLFRRAQVFLSLHRAEGLGLNIADAVAFEVPVVSTNYGGCLDFLDPDLSHLVSFSEVEVGPGCAPYSPFATWADPHIGEAAEALEKIYNDYSAAAEKARFAKLQLAETFNAGSVGKIWRSLLELSA